MTVKHLYPNSTPALNLNPKASRVADPRLNCVRNSVGTYVDPVSGFIKTVAANEMRFEKNGLLVEEGRTNLATNSTMESSDWQDHTASQSDGTIISSNNAAPDGTNTAVLMGEQTTGNFNKNCYLRQNLTVSTAGDYVISVFAKRSSTSDTDTVTVGLSGFTDSNPVGLVRFRMDTLEWSSADTSASYADRLLPVEDYGNGWYRISVRWNLASTGLTGSIRIGIAKSSISGGAGVKINRNDDNWGYFWGAQVEEGSRLTSYIPSAVGSTGNRVADEVSITGTNFSSWYNSSGGTFVFTTSARNSPRIFISQNGSSSNRTELNRSNTQARFTVNSGGAQVTNAETVFSVDNTDQHKIAFRLANPYKMAVNGNSTCSNAGGSFNDPPNPNLNRIDIGINQAGVMQIGPIQNLSFYPSALSDTALEALTK